MYGCGRRRARLRPGCESNCSPAEAGPQICSSAPHEGWTPASAGERCQRDRTGSITHARDAFAAGRRAMVLKTTACAAALLALASCSEPPEQAARAAVLEALGNPNAVQFGEHRIVGGSHACLAFDDGTGERQALLRYVHGPSGRRWEVAALDHRSLEACGVAGGGAGAARSLPAEPVAARLARADPAAGERLFRKCSACHTAAPGAPHGIGPNLSGILGAPVAARSDYLYSPALREKGGSWSSERLDAYLRSPRDFAPGTKMTFAGIAPGEDRAHLIAFLAAGGGADGAEGR